MTRPWIEVARAVEDDLLHASLGCALGHQLANFLRRLDGCSGLQLALRVLLDRRCGRNGHAAHVVDDLGVDLLGRTEHRQTRATVSSFLDRTAHTSLAAIFSALFLSHDASSLLLLAFLAEDEFASVLDALALVGLGAAVIADFSSGLTNFLLVGARDDYFGRLRDVTMVTPAGIS